MSKTKYSHKVIAVFLTLNFLSSIVPINYLFANNNGPNAPEAASFEPIDATDMVNLATGDLSYVLPLLNVPSPEGGYPLALSYHAGIAMDQEASWTGLGWTLNPGSINRSVNGYPDDWKQGVVKEYFLDKGDTDNTFSASVGVSFGNYSVGLSASWGDNRAFAGDVYFGLGIGDYASAGISVGSSGVSLNGNVGLGKDSPLSIGGSIGSNGYGANLGFGWDKSGTGKDATSKGLGLGVSVSWEGQASVNVSYSEGAKFRKSGVGFSFSSSGIGVTGKIQGVGTGLNLNMEHSLSMNNYTVKTSGWYVPIYIPLFGFAISGGFGKQSVRYFADDTKTLAVQGTNHFGFFLGSVDGVPANILGRTMDTKQIGIVSGLKELDLSMNNALLPNYDNYRVTAQGIAGSISPRINKSGVLIGTNRKFQKHDDFYLTYNTGGSNQRVHRAWYYGFDNEFSSSSLLEPATFNTNTNNNLISDYLVDHGSEKLPRKKGGRFVETFTSSRANTSTTILKANIDIDYSDQSLFDSQGIAGFKITAPDGKSYHYSLPVYNHEIVSRTFGIINERPNEDQAFFEKRQLKKYATHWLLTAVTGPDFVDVNNNQVADKEDYGYWTNFNYGKWSDGYIWYAPHGEDYIEKENDPNVKSYTWGRKEIYYLNTVETRTHKALFVKEERLDNKGKELTYVHHGDINNSVTFNCPSQSTLRLKEVILIKNDQDINLSNVVNLSATPPAINNTPHSVNFPWYDNVDNGGAKTALYSMQANVLDRGDYNASGWSELKANALKVIDFSSHYNYSLVQNAPYASTGRLTLNGLTFKGKGDVQLIPSYAFNYNNYEGFNLDKKDSWGYNSESPDNWSLKEIINPSGGKIIINYESDDFFAAFNNHAITFRLNDPEFTSSFAGDPLSSNAGFFIQAPPNEDYGIRIGDKLDTRFVFSFCLEEQFGGEYLDISYIGTSTVVEDLGNNKFGVAFDGEIEDNTSSVSGGCIGISNETSLTASFITTNSIKGGGIRVADITTTDGIKQYKTTYKYNKPNSIETSGSVSYIPYAQNANSEVPYESELPAPVVMYGNVTTASHGTDNTSLGYTKYQFKTVQAKDPNAIQFGDILEIKNTNDTIIQNTVQDKEVHIGAIVIEDNSATLGQLLSIERYNNKNHLLSQTINNYKSPDEIENNQGVISESFHTYKMIDYEDFNKQDRWMINSSTKTTYPSALKSTTVIQGGIKSTTYFDKHDFNTGQLLETRTYAGNGSVIKTRNVPAYTIKNFERMGSKVDNISWKNMLTQDAVNYTYLVDEATNTEKVLSANITTWKDTWNYRDRLGNETTPTDLKAKIWRKHKSYLWYDALDSDGAYLNFDDTNHNEFSWRFDVNLTNTNWRRVSEVTRYDHYSAPLETRDINNNYSSTKMGDNDSKILAVSNAKYTEMYYSGGENETQSYEGEIFLTGRNTAKAHTGKYSLVASTNGAALVVPMRANEHRAGKYKVSVWVEKDNADNARIFINDETKVFNGESVTAGDWVQLNHYESLSADQENIYLSSANGDVFYDDFRLLPLTSTITSYVYNEWDELTYMLGSNNLATHFVYDAAGRLIETYLEVLDTEDIIGGFKKVNTNTYHYKNQ